ncbi:VOC family protein [Cronbergia sp. UHCC 0137]|uniref:VOC family protein n=1 Tax=Cronbergia sp. UHCC 0137 TaxID=3110239 RepID=UPI002B1F0F27|nr:VOC family protein [Cronbergia sp. UHCC 0137]MEA5619212.1 VOC family protein [Cronbergia sp. UHCC 0137]
MKYTQAIATIATVNFELLVNFYTQLLEQTPKTFIPDVYAEFEVGNLQLGIFKPKNTHTGEFAGNSKSSLSLCLEVENLEDGIFHLQSLGYPPLGEISTASHGREIYAYDPDGNRLILHQSYQQ